MKEKKKSKACYLGRFKTLDSSQLFLRITSCYHVINKDSQPCNVIIFELLGQKNSFAMDFWSSRKQVSWKTSPAGSIKVTEYLLLTN